jgi:transcriptional regulator with XRE-family HTH domain
MTNESYDKKMNCWTNMENIKKAGKVNKKFVSRTEVANILDIDRRTFSNYCIGTRKIINIGIRKKLFELTGIETFNSNCPDPRDHVLLSTWVDIHIEYPSHRKVGYNDIAAKEGQKGMSFFDMATDLRNWFNNQYTWKTQKEIAEYIGISHSAIKKVFQGIKKPEGVTKQKLYEITKLECFRDEKQKKTVLEEETYVSKTKFINKMNIPIYEIERSVDKENGHTKNLKIPIHDIKTRIVEITIP